MWPNPLGGGGAGGVSGWCGTPPRPPGGAKVREEALHTTAAHTAPGEGDQGTTRRTAPHRPAGHPPPSALLVKRRPTVIGALFASTQGPFS